MIVKSTNEHVFSVQDVIDALMEKHGISFSDKFTIVTASPINRSEEVPGMYMHDSDYINVFVGVKLTVTTEIDS
jgi:hypothetical protein